MDTDELAGLLAESLERAVTTMPPDVVAALEDALEKETGKLARLHLNAILDNIRLAADRGLPVCEDTGMLTFFIEAGRDFPHLNELLDALPEAVRRATKDGPLRPNTVDPFTGRNHGDNTGQGMPLASVARVEGDGAIIHILPKGGGSENQSALWMLTPARGIDGLKRAILERIQASGGMACPPLILGIGIGGSADACMSLAKRALLRPLDSPNPRAEAAALEAEILETVNSLGLGPMGMGGRTTALAVHVEYAPRHPATFPAGMVVQCWSHRHAAIRLDSSGEVMR